MEKVKYPNKDVLGDMAVQGESRDDGESHLPRCKGLHGVATHVSTG